MTIPPGTTPTGSLPPEKQIGRYQLIELIGSGGIASVYLAFDPMFQRYVAIKLLHASFLLQAEFRKRFLREAQATARLRHPGIVEVFDYGETDDGQLHIVMELVRGPNLEQLLTKWREEQRQPPIRDAVSLMRQLAEAVAFANEQGVLHRDLKPANILLKPRWPKYTGEMLSYDPVITDFGLARLEGGLDITEIGASIGGTPAYMAPEQLGNDPLDQRCDVYSLGVIFYELVTGQLPFQLKTLPDALRQYAANPLPLRPPQLLRPDLPSGLNELIRQTLEPDRSQRLPSLQALVQALSAMPDHSIPHQGILDRTVPDLPIPNYSAPDLTVSDLTVPDLTVPERIVPERTASREAQVLKSSSQIEKPRTVERVSHPTISDDTVIAIVSPPPVRRNVAVMALTTMIIVAAAALTWFFVTRLQGENALLDPLATTSTSQTQSAGAPTVVLTATAVASGNVTVSDSETASATTAMTEVVAVVSATPVEPEVPPTGTLTGALSAGTDERPVSNIQLLAPVIGPETSHPTQLWIDGDPTDWQVLRALSKSQTTQLASVYENESSSGCQARYPGSSAAVDLSAEVQFAYDTERLYVSFLVQDDGYVANPELANYWQGDALELMLKMDMTSDSRDDEFQINLLPGIDQAGDRPTAAFRTLARSDDVRLYSEALVAAVTTENGYFLEAALPWTTLGASSPQAGEILGVAANVSDNDTPTTQIGATQLWECMLSAAPDYNQDLPESWVSLVLE